MPVFKCRGNDGIEREIELELGACDICHKIVLGETAPLLPPPVNERSWPALQAQLQQLTDKVTDAEWEGRRRYPAGISEAQPERLEELWGR